MMYHCPPSTALAKFGSVAMSARDVAIGIAADIAVDIAVHITAGSQRVKQRVIDLFNGGFQVAL
mgnify:CR=1 FL=1